ncbi:MAG: hypothetical protein JWO86_8054 [Myxococcaceae bacterium]|nr:hypothetical protein [Myxococcaceae bacterium]MEA2749688.1 hypothetical protein [Myxococcales bacterium]
MSVLFTWVVAASSLLAPARQHDELATAIANQVEAADPLFKGDEDRHRTAALLVAIAFRESSLRAAVVGDHVGGKPTSFCAFQIHLPWGAKTADGWTGADLLEDPEKCVAAALRMLRISIRVCPSSPIAWYAAGPAGCESPRAQRISRDRMAIAQRLLRDVHLTDDAPPSPLTLRRSGALDPALPRPRQFCGGA